MPLYSGLLHIRCFTWHQIIIEIVIIINLTQCFSDTFTTVSISFHIVAITCPTLPAPSNGTRLRCPDNATMYYNTVCQFACNDGYVGSGSQARRCQRNGTWGGQDLTCKGMKLNAYCNKYLNNDYFS